MKYLNRVHELEWTEKVEEEDVEANIEGNAFDGDGEVVIEMIGDEADEYENNEEEDRMKRKTADADTDDPNPEAEDVVTLTSKTTWVRLS